MLLHRWRRRRDCATSITSTLASTIGESSIGEDAIGNQTASDDATNMQARLLCEALSEFVCSSNAAFEERIERYVEYVHVELELITVFSFVRMRLLIL
jgi:hypothetical protein